MLFKEDLRIQDKQNAERIVVESAIIIAGLIMQVEVILVFMNVCKIVVAAEVF